MWLPAVFVIFGVILCVKERKGWGWSMIGLGVVSGLVVIVL